MSPERTVHELRVVTRRGGRDAVRDGCGGRCRAAPRRRATRCAPSAAGCAVHGAPAHTARLHGHGVRHTTAVAIPGRARLCKTLPRQSVTAHDILTQV